MNKNINQILEWVATNAPDIYQSLRSGASDEDIELVGVETGLDIPSDYKEFLRLHDGEDSDESLAIFGESNQLLSCKEIVSKYVEEQKLGREIYDPKTEAVEFWKDRVAGGVISVKGPVKPLTLHPNWLPMADSMEVGVCRYFDFDPAPGGIAGQIIEVDVEGVCYQVIADNFTELVRIYTRQLQGGQYEVGEYGNIERIAEENVDWGIPEWLK